MKSIKYFFISMGVILSFFSCSTNNYSKEEALPSFDFGEGTYEEPFTGLLKGKPEVLVKSLQYPPFSWVAPDTVSLEKTFSITFNEECLRSHSEAIIQFRDSSYAPLEGVQIYANGQLCTNEEIKIKADSDNKDITLKLVISPSWGEGALNGQVLIQGKELDKANSVTLQQENNVVANWTATQKIGWPILLWLLWFVGLVLLIALVVLLLWGIYHFIIYLASFIIIRIAISSPSNVSRVQKQNSRKKERKKKEKTEEEDLLTLLYKCYPEIKPVMKGFCNMSPLVFSEKTVIVKLLQNNMLSKKRFYVEFPNTKTIIEIFDKEIKAQAGALPGIGPFDSALNEFLNHPLPNKKYLVDECFIYETDSLGRTIKAKADLNISYKTLQRLQKDRYSEYSRWVNEMDGDNKHDDGGHIFACSLNGPAEKINIVPMEKEWQRHGEWVKEFEGKVRKDVKEGAKVSPVIDLLYKGQCRRPYAMRIQISTNSKPFTLYNPS